MRVIKVVGEPRIWGKIRASMGRSIRPTTTNERTPYGNIVLSDKTIYEPKPAVRLNRSRKWRPALTYAEARFQSKSSRPVR